MGWMAVLGVAAWLLSAVCRVSVCACVVALKITVDTPQIIRYK